ncbi:MAG: hypothetical protein FJ096_11855 [Deltaproteobacteria bacterium]|nr:hypothetical protein [Deltaproteobacteria bacterium]
MASLRLVGDSVVLSLSTLEKVGALHGDVRVPRAAVRRVRRVARPLGEVRGFRSPGTGIPWVLALATYRTLQSRDFVAAHRGPGLVVELEGQPYARLVVSTPDASSLADELGA